MTPSRSRLRRACASALLLLVTLATVACQSGEDAPQTSLDPAGPFAAKPDGLWNLTFGIAVIIFFLVEGVLLFVLLRFRHKEGRVAAQFHGNTKVEVLLTAVPALILAGIAVPTVGTIFDLADKPDPDAINVTVVAHQFWWEYRYEDFDFVTANELHMPVDKDVYLKLEGAVDDGFGGAEVIHSFWIPRLGGTQDIVPGHANFIKYRADEPGRFLGQCKELCGLGHGYMRIVAHAQTQEDFDQWVSDQQSPASEAQQGDAAAGKELFTSGEGMAQPCAGCHSLEASAAAKPNVGPNLAHFASRGTFAGAIFENNTENLQRWLRDPPGVKPGAKMPNLGLSSDQITALVAYLESLE